MKTNSIPTTNKQITFVLPSYMDKAVRKVAGRNMTSVATVMRQIIQDASQVNAQLRKALENEDTPEEAVARFAKEIVLISGEQNVVKLAEDILSIVS